MPSHRGAAALNLLAGLLAGRCARRAFAGIVLCCGWALAGAALSAEPLLIVDAHLHYSQPAWSGTPPAAVLALLDQAGVIRAIASSTPDDGTVMLYQLAPRRIVPFLRPYRGSVNSSNWTQDADLPAYLDARLKRGIYRGIGEFHLWGNEGDAPNLRHVVNLGVARDLFLEVHSGAGPVRGLFAINPKVKVLWAHAGMNEGPAAVGQLLDQHASLWCEVSFRAGDIAPDGRLNSQWDALFRRHPDRFLIGTDTYTPERLGEYVTLIGEHRRWLAQLPPEVAAAIAHGNATRLLGAAP